jgi:uncharacterized protein
MSAAASVLWRRLDRPGHEAAHVVETDDGWTLSGVAVFLHEGDACDLAYRILCGRDWRTRRAEVTGRVGGREVLVRAEVGPSGDWIVGGAPLAELSGCVDVDLNFSPSTNLLPIRRLSLAVGEERPVRAAWLRFPSFRFEPLDQTYRRLAPDRYLYTSGGGRFEAELEVDGNGFVILYPGFAERV